MKYIDLKDIENLPGRMMAEDESFTFRCHAGLECFNRCCRNLNLFLYPYDVLRLKNGLGISSDRFIDDYTDIVLRPGNFFPDVLLKMAGDKEKSCIFLTENGCRIYADRPDTCRAFPMEFGFQYDAKTKRRKPVCFFRPPEFCRGGNEPDVLTPNGWIADQDGETHNKMTAKWAELKQMFQSNPWGREGPEGPKGKMAFMAAYNIDRFHEFIFGSTFLKRYKIKSDLLKKIKKDETRLLRLGFDWIKFSVWGVKSKLFRPR